ncbi:U1 small nuclear ribonucleoprotein C-1-like [Triticum urartu]|uniref:U1 small nuclear ribonucleoprotein C n=1 Tax=Triticum urartu TaxID=4572 RepID=A0A8R7THK9_TRIUA|nr:U1 small nuclear ribonucleoprotein C-1-like [Triticum urartu]XP_048556840.1 U1 small nuclear ribonucleoprotein C-1-like [Triticum urartu]
MPRYYCDYCDTYLTHDSPSVRKQHNAGYKHKANVRNYYQQFEEQQTQSLIDQRIKEHLGQAAAFQVGAPFNQHLLQYPGNMPRPRLPILPTPMMQHGYPQHQQPGGPFARPPILPVPGAPGYPGAPTMPQHGGPPGSMPMQVAPLPRPPTLPPPTSGAPGAPMSNNASPPGPPPMYQPNQPPTAGSTSGAPPLAPAAPPQAAFSYAQSNEGNH